MNEQNKPAERTMEWAVERSEKIAAVTRNLVLEGGITEGNRSLVRDGDSVIFTDGENTTTFEDYGDAIDAFVG